jgi:hypothetical protein
MNHMQQHRQQFLKLADDVCEELNYPPCSGGATDDSAISMEMEVNDIPFVVTHDENNHPDMIQIECDFGKMPQERTEAVLYRLLHTNLELADAGAGVLGIKNGNNKVIHARNKALAPLTGRLLLNIMTEMAWQAELWRDTYYLEDEVPAVQGLGFGALA